MFLMLLRGPESPGSTYLRLCRKAVSEEEMQTPGLGEKATLFGYKCERDYLLMKKSEIKGKRVRGKEKGG